MSVRERPDLLREPPRLLIVAHFFEPFAGTGARRPTRLARFLARRGVPPVVVTASPEFYGDAVSPGPSARDELRVHEVPRNGVHRLLGRAGAVGRPLLNALLMRAYRRAIERALAEGPSPDFIYLCGNPFWLFPLGQRFRRACGLPYVLDFPDVYYAGGVRYRLGHRWGPRRIVDRLVESRAVADAGVVVHTSQPQTALYRRRYPAVPPERFVTIRWGYDAEAVRGLTPTGPRDDDVLRIGLFGKFAAYDASDARSLAEAIGVLHARTLVEVMHLGEPEPALAQAFRTEGLSGCFRPAGRRAYAEGMAALASADVLVLNAVSDLSLPAKLYDYVYLNRPVVAMVAAQSAAWALLGGFSGAFRARTALEVTAALERVRADRVRELEPGLDPTEFSQQYQFGLLLDALDAARAGEAQGGG